MPSPFETAAERIAPTRSKSNFFDPAAGQSVISRYASSGREMTDAADAATQADRLLDARDSLDRRRHNRVVFDREEQDYEDRQAFRNQRAQFLETISQLQPDADDFEDQISGLYKSLPQAALADDAVTDMLAYKRKVADDLRNERQYQGRREEQFKDRERLYQMRLENDPRLANLPPEERNRFYGPDGDFDYVGAAQRAYEIGRANKVEDAVNRTAAVEDWKRENMPEKSLSAEEKRLKGLAREHILGDAEAFPNQVDVLRRGLTKTEGEKAVPPKEEDLKKDPRYQDARLYESRKFEAELESARNMGRDAYIAKGGSSENAKRKRAEVWEFANLGRPAEGAAAPATPALPSAPAVGTEEDGYVFTGGDPADSKNWKKK